MSEGTRKRRWYHPTPDRFFIGLLVVQVLVFLSEQSRHDTELFEVVKPVQDRGLVGDELPVAALDFSGGHVRKDTVLDGETK